MTIYTGFISGSVTYDDNGTRTLLPFGDKIMEASVEILGEVLFAETFSANGIKGKSAACPYKQEVNITFNSSDISWSYLQAVLGTRSNARTAALPQVESRLAVDNGGNIEITLSETPATGSELLFANLDGDQFTGTLAGQVVTFASGVSAGDTIISRYTYDAPANTDEIAYGKTDVITEYGVYGVFKGCPDSIILVADRAVLQPEVEFGVGDDAASAAVTMNCLRNDEGAYATLIRV